MRKKIKRSVRSRRRSKHFLVRRSYFIFTGTLVLALVLFLNPKPADLTFDNVYKKLSHTMLHEESEYVTDAYVNNILAQDGTFQDPSVGGLAAIFENQPITTSFQPPTSYGIASVLPANIDKHAQAAVDNKWIEVDLSDQKLYAWENGSKVFEFIISSGKPWTPTVTGDFRIWIKLRYANMKGGSKELGDYYFLPNVPYVMYFYKGYGLHGTYWHNNFGQVMSHGCVNMRTEDAGQLFEWVTPYLDGKSVIKSSSENPGTRVVVHD